MVLIAKAPGVGPVGSQTQAMSPDNHQMHLDLTFYDSFFKANIEIKYTTVQKCKLILYVLLMFLSGIWLIGSKRKIN